MYFRRFHELTQLLSEVGNKNKHYHFFPILTTLFLETLVENSQTLPKEVTRAPG